MLSAVRCMHESLSINKHVFKSPYLFSLSQFLLLCRGAQKLGYMVSKAQPQNPDTTRCQRASLRRCCVGSPVLWHRGHTCLPDGHSGGPKWPGLPGEISHCAFWRGRHSPKAFLRAVVGQKTKDSPSKHIVTTRQAPTSCSCVGGRAQP